jgi:lysylphosphatidylglycerol synthetase-like protein (DUF2156 family)
VKAAERTMGFGIVAGLVVSQANLALFDDLIHRQASFEAVGWANWFLYLLVPILAGGLLLYYGRMPRDGADRRPERALAASLLALLGATVLLRVAVPAILHAGDVLPGRLPRTLADGFSFVADSARLAPLAGHGHGYDVAAATVSAAVLAAAIAFGALAFERRLLVVLVSAAVGAAWSLVGWYVPGGAGERIIGALWPIVVLCSVGLVIGVLDDRL